MKEEIITILGYLECEGEMSLLQNQILSLSASRPAELQQTIFNLLDAIKHTNIQSHGHAGFYYLFLGCAYYEQDEFQKTEVSLQSAIAELWGSQVNKALARWLLGLCYSNLQEFSRARNELQEALQLLASHRGSNSPRTERDHRSRQIYLTRS
jgi:tetratricopeptide (TPR) repeat protein